MSDFKFTAEDFYDSPASGQANADIANTKTQPLVDENAELKKFAKWCEFEIDENIKLRAENERLKHNAAMAMDEANECRLTNAKLIDDVISAQTENERLKFVPGHFQCKKCGFSLVSQTIFINQGKIGANTDPQECANRCGPMWKVSWQDHAEALCSSAEIMAEELAAQKAKIEKGVVVYTTFGPAKDLKGPWFEIGRGKFDTHTAKLVDIQPINPEDA